MIDTYGVVMFLLGSVVGAIVKTFIEFGIRRHFEKIEKKKRKEKKAAKKAAKLAKLKHENQTAS